MKLINTIAFILLILGGLNWGLVGITGIDAVQHFLGGTVIAKAIYILIGLSAIWKAYGWCCCTSSCSK